MSQKISVLLFVGFCSNVRLSASSEELEPMALNRSVFGYGGGNYVRWGRTVCPGDAQLVYRGQAGGSRYSHPGGASNYLCLPDDAEMSTKMVSGNSALLCGAEYKLGTDLQNHNVPCVVCETERPNILMIPARTKCYYGWTVEYVGYLSAGYFDHEGASEYVCLDKDAETMPGGESETDGKLFYLAGVKCDILPCPPFSQTFAVPCVVCSK